MCSKVRSIGEGRPQPHLGGPGLVPSVLSSVPFGAEHGAGGTWTLSLAATPYTVCWNCLHRVDNYIRYFEQSTWFKYRKMYLGSQQVLQYFIEEV